MNLPSRVVSYKDSVVSKFPLILRALSLDEAGMSPLALYNAVKDGMHDIAEYTEALDCLYVLGKVELDERRGVLSRVDGDVVQRV